MRTLQKVAPGRFNWVEVPDPPIWQPTPYPSRSLTPVLHNITLPHQPGFVRRERCMYLGRLTGEKAECTSCGSKGTPVPVHECLLIVGGDRAHPLCTLDRPVSGAACCQACPDHSPKVMKVSPPGPFPLPSPFPSSNGHVERTETREIRWGYGVTTVPSRRDTLLANTLDSLDRAGFGVPHLFVDGYDQDTDWSGYRLLSQRVTGITFHTRKVRAYGHWLLSLLELYILYPTAHRYAIFQDDVLACRGLREYLESQRLPVHGYWNLYTVAENLAPAEQAGRSETSGPGWFKANQMGKGALALVLSAESVRRLLLTPSIIEKPHDPNNGWKKIDGAVVTALSERHRPDLAGANPPHVEWCHYPSLVQHAGDATTITDAGGNGAGSGGGGPHGRSPCFRGEEFDCMSLLG